MNHQKENFITCFHYIHQNPLMAKLVSRLEDWDYSSFKDYAGLRDGKLCRKDLANTYCDYQPDNFMAKSYEPAEKKLIAFIK